MNPATLKAGGTKLAALKQLSEKPWFYPAILLLIGLLTHGYTLASLGFYWDDWEVVFLLNTKLPALLYGYFSFDRPFAWPYQLMGTLAGLNPIGWHIAALLARWAGILLLYYSLKFLWPRRSSYLRWLGALLITYPGFFQQSASTAYFRHFISFFLFGLSIYLMVLAVTRPKWGRLFFPLSWLIAALQILTIEYFATLELIRPLLLWMLIADRDKKISVSIRKTVLASLPYLLIFGVYFYWRSVIFPASLATKQYAADVKFLADFQPSFVGGLLTLFTRAFIDLFYASLQVWVEGLFRQDSFTFQSKIAWFAFGLGILIAMLFAFFNDVKDTDEEPGRDNSQSVISIFAFGLYAFIVSGLPIWATARQISGIGRFDDRFTLAPMFGAGLMLIALILWLARSKQHKSILVFLLTFSIATQVLVVNKYRLDWQVQRDYYWQLYWRVPALQTGTAIFSYAQPSPTMPGYDTSFALNVLFNGKVVDGKTPYWFFTNDRFLNFDFKPGLPISYTDRNLQFSGNTSNAISIVHQGDANCLQVLDTVYSGQPFYVEGNDALIAVSNVSRILADPQAAALPAGVFGPEPARNWCYFFEKADLARQQGNWQTILSLEAQALKLGLAPKFGAEYIPFIEARAQTGDWRKAYELSLAAQKLTAGMEPVLCANWNRLGNLPASDAQLVNQARQDFSCSAP